MWDRRERRVTVQFLKFNAVGLVNTAVDFTLYTLLLFWGMGSLGAHIISYAAGTLNSFVMNKKITFTDGEGAQDERESKSILGQFIRFAVLNAAVLALSLMMLFVLSSAAGLHPLVSKVIVMAVTVCLNFAGNRRWVFAKQVYGRDKSSG